MKPTSLPDLYVIGLGVMIPDHVTIQATRAMSQCAKLFSIVQESPRLWLPPDKLGQIEVINALQWYEEDRLRSENYERAARTIINALGGGMCAGYVTYGNPMAYDRVAQNLLQYAQEEGLVVQVVPGISSFDTILCDLRLDMAPGIQIFEASWMLACRIQPCIDVPVLLMQVGAFGSLRTHYTKRQNGSSLIDLVEYFCKMYPRSHQVSLIRSTGQEDHPAVVRDISLGNLCEATAEDLSGASLYIPPVQMAMPQKDILAKMSLS